MSEGTVGRTQKWDTYKDFREIITARIRRRGKVLFTVCLSVHISRGYPSQVWGGTPSQVWPGGYPIPGLGREVPHPRSECGGGYLGYSHPLNQVRMGYPPTWPGLDGVLPGPGMGYPLTWDGVPPWTWNGVPPDLGRSTPLDLGWGTPPGIASTCYAAGGMPLAFTQEDFLVLKLVLLQCFLPCLNVAEKTNAYQNYNTCKTK